jgi:ABC-2 type transport system permease protein
MLELLKFEIRNRRGAIIGWGLGLASFAFIYLPFFPQLADQMANLDINSIPLYQALGNFEMATFEGYFASTVLQFFAVIFAIFAVVNGTAALAGEEEAGTLELQAALPLSRGQLVMAKGVALLVSAVLILVIASVGVMLAVALVGSQIETELTPLGSLPAVWNSLPITLFFLMLSLFLSAYLPTRRAASTVGTVVVILSYFGNNLAGMIESLDGLQNFMPFHYYRNTADIFTEGVPMSDVLVLLAAALVCYLLAMISFRRRDLTVGLWPWQRSSG